MAPILSELFKEVSHLLQSCENGTSKQVYARTTTENEKDNIKVCVCSLSHLMTVYFSLSG